MSSGGRKPRVTDDDILTLFQETSDPVLSTAEVSDALPIGRRGVLDRLHALADDGHLDHKNIGGRNMVWWLTGGVDEAESGLSESREPTPDPGAEPPGESAEETAPEAALATVEFPQGKKREECVEAVLAARDYLRQSGGATKKEFVTEVMPDHPLGYDVKGAREKIEAGDRYRGAWWRRVIKPGLQALEDVEPPAPGQSEWRYAP